MSEEQTPQNESTPVNSNEGNLNESVDKLAELDSKIKRMEEANAKAERLRDELVRLETRRALSGRANAGQNFQTAQQTQEEQDAEEIKKGIARFY